MLHRSSANVLDVFTKTVNSLSAINEQIDKSVSNKEAMISRLEADKVVLNKLKDSHGAVINKLNSILKD